MPKLKGRVAKCTYCDNEQPSSTSLAFFRYRGPGSEQANQTCVCGYYKGAHIKGSAIVKCKKFKARGPEKKDEFYCGCRGWD